MHNSASVRSASMCLPDCMCCLCSPLDPVIMCCHCTHTQLTTHLHCCTGAGQPPAADTPQRPLTAPLRSQPASPAAATAHANSSPFDNSNSPTSHPHPTPHHSALTSPRAEAQRPQSSRSCSKAQQQQQQTSKRRSSEYGETDRCSPGAYPAMNAARTNSSPLARRSLDLFPGAHPASRSMGAWEEHKAPVPSALITSITEGEEGLTAGEQDEEEGMPCIAESSAQGGARSECSMQAGSEGDRGSVSSVIGRDQLGRHSFGSIHKRAGRHRKAASLGGVLDVPCSSQNQLSRNSRSRSSRGKMTRSCSINGDSLYTDDAAACDQQEMPVLSSRISAPVQAPPRLAAISEFQGWATPRCG